MDTPWMDKETGELYRHKVGLAEMLKGGVIMDVTNAEQAKIAEEAGAVAVMAPYHRVTSDRDMKELEWQHGSKVGHTSSWSAQGHSA